MVNLYKVSKQMLTLFYSYGQIVQLDNIFPLMAPPTIKAIAVQSLMAYYQDCLYVEAIYDAWWRGLLELPNPNDQA